jgi:putative hemolysin
MASKILLLLLAILTILLSSLFSGAETGMYRLSRLRLRLGIEKKRLQFIMLGKAIHDSSGLLLSILVGNNLSNYAATSIITGVFLSIMYTERTAELFATLLAAPILFVFAELIPKNLFFYRADILMPVLAPPLYLLHKFFTYCGAVPSLRLISSFFVKITGSHVPSKTVIASTRRHQVSAILQDSHEEGIISPIQSDIINRIVKVPYLYIRSVMVPINKVEKINVSSDRSALLNKLKRCTFTRLPVVGASPDDIFGFIDVYEILISVGEFDNLHDLVKPIRKLDASTTVIDAINIMQREKQKIVLVTRTGYSGRERAVGIVTMKDLVEELLGELAEW